MAAESPEGEPGDRNRRCFLEHNNDLVINRIDREAYDEEVHSGPYRGSPYSLISLWRAAAGPADYRACGNQRGAPGPTRTGDLRFRKPTLYPLSYWGTEGRRIIAKPEVRVKLQPG